jgi:hypothetical protein
MLPSGVPPDIVLTNGIRESDFLAHFPLPFIVAALSPWEARDLNLDWTKTWWRFAEEFIYVSDRFGEIRIPKGFITDFASIPDKLESFYSSDERIMLLPSAPHDYVFGLGGKLPDGRVLTFDQANDLMAEAQFYVGANGAQRAQIKSIITIFGRSHWKKE